MKKSKQGKCPACGSNNLHYGSLQLNEDNEVYYPFNCNECGASGKEIYELKNGQTLLNEDFAIKDLQSWTDKMQAKDNLRNKEV